jgi:hypothetical protein
MTDKEVIDRLTQLEQLVMSIGAMLSLTMQKVELLERSFVDVCHDNATLELALFTKNEGTDKN